MLSEYHFMEVAKVIAQAGTCSRLQVGAVITRDRRIVSTGYNGAPSGVTHCQHTVSDICEVAVHAEANAIAFAAKHGIATDRSILWTTDSPCLKCAQLIINAGIRQVVYGRKYRDESGINLLVQVGIGVAGHYESAMRSVPSERGDGEGVYSSKYGYSEIESPGGTD